MHMTRTRWWHLLHDWHSTLWTVLMWLWAYLVFLPLALVASAFLYLFAFGFMAVLLVKETCGEECAGLLAITTLGVIWYVL